MRRVAIFGAGGFAREVYSFLKDVTNDQVACFVARDSEVGSIDGIPILTEESFWNSEKSVNNLQGVYVAIGDSRIREKVAKRIAESCVSCLNFIHPSASLPKDLKLGKGTIIYPQVSMTACIEIGDFVLLNSACTIGHDTRIGDFSNVNPGANIAGNVEIGRSAFIGIGASLIEGVKVGAGSIIGAGAVVINDIPSNVTAIGVPARIIKKRE